MVLYSRRTREADMARRGQVARPRGPTQTLVWCLRGRATQAHVDACVAPTWRDDVFGLVGDGPTG